MRRLGVAVACLLALVLADRLAGEAEAQDDRGLYSVNPARRDIRAQPPEVLGSTTLKNTTRSELSVRVVPALVDQHLDGALVPLDDPRDVAAARRLISAQPRRFELGTGEERSILSRWKRLPGKDKSAYVALVFEGVPPEPEQTGIRTVVRLSQPNLLALPGVVARDGAISGLRADQGGEKELVFHPRVRNDSEVHGNPRERRFRIEDEDGEVVFEESWRVGGPVLPGEEVEYPIQVGEVLPAGDYRAVASMRFEKARGRDRRVLEFSLVGPNELPVTRFDLRTISAGGEEGKAATATVELRNTGTASGAAELVANLREAGQGGKPLASEVEETGEVAPNETITAEVGVGELDEIDYELEVIARSEGAEVDRLSAVFTPTPAQSFGDELGDFLGETLVWILAGVGLALAAFFGIRYHRLKQRLADAEDQGSTPAR